VCAFLTRASIQFIREEFGSAPARFHIGSVPIPSMLFEIILPLGFLLLLVHYALRAVADLVELRR